MSYTYLSLCLYHKLCEPLIKINQFHLYNLLIFFNFLLFFSFILFFLFIFHLLLLISFYLTLSTFAFSICKREALVPFIFRNGFLFFFNNSKNTSSIPSFVFLFEWNNNKNKNKKNETEEKLNLADETVTLRTTHLFPVVLWRTSGPPPLCYCASA